MAPWNTSPRKRQGACQPKSSPKVKAKTNKFAKAATMPTAKFQMDEQRKGNDTTTDLQYLGPPPENENLFEATLVLPMHTQLPDLAEPSSLNAINTDKEVWIVQEKPNVLHLYSRTMLSLQEGFKAVNWAIHDMRLARQNVSARFLVQMPVNAHHGSPITVHLESRPLVEHSRVTSAKPTEVAYDILEQLGANCMTSTNAMQTLNGPLQMRVEFGHVSVRRKKRGVGNTMSYSDFTEMAQHYGTRGGASLDTRLANVNDVSKLISHLSAPSTNVYHGHENVAYKESIEMKLGDQTLRADVEYSQNGRPNLTNTRLVVTGQWPPLNWTILAPDRKYDWCLRVDNGTEVQPLPQKILSLIQDVILLPESKRPEDLENRRARIRIKNAEKWITELGTVHQILAAQIPFRDTPFVVEVSRNHEWISVNTSTAPNSWLGIRVIGRHWEDSLNYKWRNGSKKDWGVNQSDVWAGSEMTTEGQFAGFVCHVLEVLSALEYEKRDETT